MQPAASWQQLMNNLQRHFGSDALLDAATVKELSDWLAANAGGREAPHVVLHCTPKRTIGCIYGYAVGVSWLKRQ